MTYAPRTARDHARAAAQSAPSMRDLARVHDAMHCTPAPVTHGRGERHGWRWHVGDSLLTPGAVSVWAWDGQRTVRGEVADLDAAREWVRALRDGAGAWPKLALGDPLVGMEVCP